MITQFKKGVLELCVLSLLDKKDCYGYELVEIISRGIMVSEGTIYPILRRFTKEGHCNTYLKESNTGPPRKYYTITPSGESYYHNFKKEWEDFSSQVKIILDTDLKEVDQNE